MRYVYRRVLHLKLTYLYIDIIHYNYAMCAYLSATPIRREQYW